VANRCSEKRTSPGFALLQPDFPAIDDSKELDVLPTPFQSPQAFRDTFASGLEAMLRDHQELGVFILVLANAAFDPEVGERLKRPLLEHYRTLKERFQNSDPSQLGAPDDVAVFQRLLESGLEQPPPVLFRRAGIWELQFNRLRSFRPLRNAGAASPGLFKPFNRDGFHFGKPFLQKEVIWQGALLGREWRLFYNKFPFVALHGLLVPEVEQGLPQFIDGDELQRLWQLTETLAQGLPGIGFGYNAAGAYSSVNHLHFQSFVRQQPLPIESPRWQHCGGDTPYPLHCQRFDELDQAKGHLAHLHQQETHYNLLMRPGRCYFITRARQGQAEIPAWSAGFAWYEVSGGFVCFEEGEYRRLDEAGLGGALGKVA
jgi:hypothetical protein